MSTNSTITVITKKDQAIKVYCHWDGYPSYNGAMLLEHYNTMEKATELVKLGDISVLKPRLAPNEGEEHSFSKPLDDVTIFYGRDRGETDVEPVIDDPVIIYFPKERNMLEWNYLFDGEKWLVSEGQRGFRPLTRKMCGLD